MAVQDSRINELQKLFRDGSFQQCLVSANELANVPALSEQTRLFRGYCLLRLGRLQEGVSVLEPLTKSRGSDGELLFNVGVGCLNCGLTGRAIDYLARACRVDVGNVQFGYHLALAQFHDGDFRRCIGTLSSLKAGGEWDHSIVLLMVKSFNAIKDFSQSFSLIVKVRKSGMLEDLDGRIEVGRALSGLQRDSEAEMEWLYARALGDHGLVATAMLADLYERRNELQKLNILIDGMDFGSCTNAALLLVVAKLWRRSKRFAESEGLLAKAEGLASSNGLLSSIKFEQGRLHDATSRYDEAFLDFSKANSLAVDEFCKSSRSPPRTIDELRWLNTRFISGSGFNTNGATFSDGLADPAFIVGFPRSGTTLLEQVLAAHSDIECMEEKPILTEIHQRYLDTYADVAMENVPSSFFLNMREYYWREAKRHGASCDAKLLVDKNPFNIVRVLLIKRMFPTSRVIVSLRHPCDVVLSCFMQRFPVRDSVVGFHSLPVIAEIYSRTMRRWLDERVHFDGRYRSIRYEDFVVDLFASARALITFLGLPWDDAILGYLEKAKAKDRINTPSYHQVVQPVYRTATYRWLHYQRHFDDVLPQLKPFIAEFGYEPEVCVGGG